MNSKKVALLLLLGFLMAPLRVASQEPPPGTKSQSSSAADVRRETFELVWSTINEHFYDPHFNGVDWKAIHDRYAPLVAATSSDDQLHRLLQQMINELHQSHFFVLPPSAIPKLAESDEEDSGLAFEPDENARVTKPMPTVLDRIRSGLTRRLSTGVGIDVRLMDGMPVVTHVTPGSSAAEAGLRPGLAIRSANGTDLTAAVKDIETNPIWHEIMKPEIPEVLIARYINGEPNSALKLVYLDGLNREHTVTMVRRRLEGEMSPAIGNLPPMYTEFEQRRFAGGIGYIRFNAFVPLLMKKVCAALRSMNDAPGLILDLRGNHGGLLGMASGISGLIDQNSFSIGMMQSRDGISSMYSFPQREPYRGRIVILIDGTSESAAEMFAAGLQESGRAFVIGQVSAGNVVPSAFIRLPTGALLQYGIAKYLSPHGSVLEGRGVVPDLLVVPTRRVLLSRGDPQLSAAIAKLQRQDIVKRPPRTLGVVTIRAAKPKSVTIADPPMPVSQEAVNEAADDQPPPAKPSAELRADDPRPESNDLPSAAQVIDKYLQAIGGEQALSKLSSRVSTGTVELTTMGIKGRAELFEEAPNRWSLVMNISGLGTMTDTFDGTQHFFQSPVEGLVTFPVSATTAKVEDFQKELALKKDSASMIVTGHEKVNGRDAVAMYFQYPNGYRDKYFFDSESGLLLRRNNVYYEDYRDVDGVKLPFITRQESAYGSMILQMKEIKHNVPIDPGKFIEIPDCFTAPHGNSMR